MTVACACICVCALGLLVLLGVVALDPLLPTDGAPEDRRLSYRPDNDSETRPDQPLAWAAAALVASHPPICCSLTSRPQGVDSLPTSGGPLHAGVTRLNKKLRPFFGRVFFFFRGVLHLRERRRGAARKEGKTRALRELVHWGTLR